jgi:hypothetical protein
VLRLVALTGPALDEGAMPAGTVLDHATVAIRLELEVLLAAGTARGAAVRDERTARGGAIRANWKPSGREY